MNADVEVAELRRHLTLTVDHEGYRSTSTRRSTGRAPKARASRRLRRRGVGLGGGFPSPQKVGREEEALNFLNFLARSGAFWRFFLTQLAPQTHPSAPEAPRFSRLGRSTCAPIPKSWIRPWLTRRRCSGNSHSDVR